MVEQITAEAVDAMLNIQVGVGTVIAHPGPNMQVVVLRWRRVVGGVVDVTLWLSRGRILTQISC